MNWHSSETFRYGVLYGNRKFFKRKDNLLGVIKLATANHEPPGACPYMHVIKHPVPTAIIHRYGQLMLRRKYRKHKLFSAVGWGQPLYEYLMYVYGGSVSMMIMVSAKPLLGHSRYVGVNRHVDRDRFILRYEIVFGRRKKQKLDITSVLRKETGVDIFFGEAPVRIAIDEDKARERGTSVVSPRSLKGGWAVPAWIRKLEKEGKFPNDARKWDGHDGRSFGCTTG